MTTLLHIWGPLSIQAYGSMIFLGIVVFLYFLHKDPVIKPIISTTTLFDIVALGIVTGIIGGRILYILEYWNTFTSFGQIFAIWDGGFSILGTLIALLIVIPRYLKKRGIPMYPFLDRVGVYAPLTQAISRLGCFIAGCCYGIATTSCLAVTYTDPTSLAPLNAPLHPTQLYSALLLFFIFLLLYYIGQKKLKKPGQLFSAYLMLVSSQRFFVDSLRADRSLIQNILSLSQVCALAIFLVGLVLFLRRMYYPKPGHLTKR